MGWTTKKSIPALKSESDMECSKVLCGRRSWGYLPTTMRQMFGPKSPLVSCLRTGFPGDLWHIHMTNTDIRWYSIMKHIDMDVAKSMDHIHGIFHKIKDRLIPIYHQVVEPHISIPQQGCWKLFQVILFPTRWLLHLHPPACSNQRFAWDK